MAKATLHVARRGRVIFCLGYNAWGKGKDSDEAIKNWRPNAYVGVSRKHVEVVLVEASNKAWIDVVDGQVLRPSNVAPSRELERRKVCP